MREQPPASRPLRILLTTDVVGGVWDFCQVLANELTRAGHQVTLLAIGAPTSEHRRQAARIGVPLLDAQFKLEWMQDSADDVRASRAWLARLAAELRPDVLHVNQYALADVEADAPVVLTAHSDVLGWRKWTLDGGVARPTPPEWAGYANVVRAGLQEADAAVAVSAFLGHELRELYEVGRDLQVVHNGWPCPAGQPRSVSEREQLTLLAGRAWDDAKNVGLAAAAARGWDPGRVVLAGDRYHPETGSAVELGPPIVALGRCSRGEVDRLLGLARVYLAPARYEPFGLLPLQAALAGCPLVLSDIPSFRELWDGAALFFQPDDPSDLRRHWARLLADDRLADDLAARARDLAETRYASERMAAEYAAIYARLVGRRPAAGAAVAGARA